MSVNQQRLYRKVNLLKGVDNFQVVFWMYSWFRIYAAELSAEVEKWLSFSCGAGVHKSEFPSLNSKSRQYSVSVNHYIWISCRNIGVLAHPCKCIPVYLTVKCR